MGEYTVHLVGESNYQPAVRALRPGDQVTLVPEPDNPHDAKAVRAAGPDGRTIGYIARGDWLQRVLHEDQTAIFARVKHIMGGDAARRSLGVVLVVWTAAHASNPPDAAAIAALSAASEADGRPGPAGQGVEQAQTPPAWPWMLLAFGLIFALALLS